MSGKGRTFEICATSYQIFTTVKITEYSNKSIQITQHLSFTTTFLYNFGILVQHLWDICNWYEKKSLIKIFFKKYSYNQSRLLIFLLLTSSLDKWILYHISWQIHPLSLVQARQSKLSKLHPADLWSSIKMNRLMSCL